MIRTPGQWFADEDGYIHNGDGTVVAGAYSPTLDDARLIAAAPELLAALVELLDKEDMREAEGVEHIDAAYAAIRKATGE